MRHKYCIYLANDERLDTRGPRFLRVTVHSAAPCLLFTQRKHGIVCSQLKLID